MRVCCLSLLAWLACAYVRQVPTRLYVLVLVLVSVCVRVCVRVCVCMCVCMCDHLRDLAGIELHWARFSASQIDSVPCACAWLLRGVRRATAAASRRVARALRPRAVAVHRLGSETAEQATTTTTAARLHTHVQQAQATGITCYDLVRALRASLFMVQWASVQGGWLLCIDAPSCCL